MHRLQPTNDARPGITVVSIRRRFFNRTRQQSHVHQRFSSEFSQRFTEVRLAERVRRGAVRPPTLLFLGGSTGTEPQNVRFRGENTADRR